MVGLDELCRRFLAMADSARPRAPAQALLSASIATMPDVAGLLLTAPDEQQLPVLLLAALHDQVLLDPGCELAGWYPTVTDTPRDDDPGPAIRRHVLRTEAAMRSTLSSCSTQTNEVGRCATFLPALGLVAAELGPLALVDVGTSAGLNLRLDRYEYAYEPGGSVGVPSPVRLETSTRGAVPVPPALPMITGRLGIDRAPIDLSDPAAVRWLRACVWPDQVDRFRRLAAAVAIADERPAEVWTADAVDALDAAVGHLAGSGHPVVMNSWVLNYLPTERRTAYLAELDRIGGGTDVTWIFAESPAQAGGLPVPARLRHDELTVLGMVTWRSGERRVHHLGTTHPHGYWLHWDA
ncbi:MAG: DUF2332 domain-containing protein [Ilumatobacteraceae bacterium]